jgi:acyl-CoA synthetase (AMP-forming)/AMP-acid ligase II
VPSEPGGTALLLYTSGTTSRPKGVRTPHRALVVTGVAGMVGRMGMTADDAVWSPAPLCHIGAYVALVGAFATGARFVSAPYFHADGAIELLDREQVTIAYAGFPAFYLDLANRLRETGRQLTHLRVLTTAAAPGEIERVRQGFPHTLQVSVTGSTELSGMICVNHSTDTPEQRATTAGLPLDGIEVSIRDERGTAVEAGATGEIWVRGYCLLSGYHKDPRPAVTGEPDPGWYRTGDLGALVEGRLSFRGRIKDMIKVGGENVAAAEIEGFLLRHPAVALVQVVAAPDARLGEVPVAFVEVAPGHAVTGAELIEFCRGAMAAYKVPRAVRFVTEWPTSATKISKPALRALLTG